jgi:O-antigen/teichoic acid export membrane protein
MNDDPDVLERRVAYLDQIRHLYRRERTIGLTGCLVGVMLLILARYRLPAAPWAMWAAVAIIAAAWLLFAYVVFKRTAWVRAHPFDPTPHG